MKSENRTAMFLNIYITNDFQYVDITKLIN